MRNKKLFFYIGFPVVFLAVFYVALFWGTDEWKVKLPVLSDVKPFRFADQAGDTVTERNMEGKVCVVSFFFTTCKGICPRMEDNLKTQVYEVYKSEPDFMVLSHTVDPEADSVQRLKHYADSLGVEAQHWLFLTGTKENLYKAARISYLLDNQNDSKVKIQEQFIHTQLVALVDKNGRVRGIYDGLNQEELGKLRRDVGVLLKETASGNHFVNGIFNNNPS
jgi:protein SCO1/2